MASGFRIALLEGSFGQLCFFFLIPSSRMSRVYWLDRRVPTQPAANLLDSCPAQSCAMYYRPIKIRIPASSASIPMTLFGITKRTINGSPCKINQTASNIIPTDILSLLFLMGRDKRDNNSKLFVQAFHSVNTAARSRRSTATLRSSRSQRRVKRV